MVYFIWVWILLGLGCSIFGMAVLTALGGIDRQHWQHEGDRLLMATWLGLVLLAIGFLTVSLVGPVSTGVGWLVLTGLCLGALLPATQHALQAHYAGISSRALWIGGAGLVAIATFMAQPVDWIDSGLYHYSAIQWLFQFGTVHGLGLVMANLGFTSSWFAIAAPFNPPVLAARGTAVMNGFVFGLAAITFWQCTRRIGRPQARFADGFITTFLGLLLPLTLALSLLLDILISPSPDFPVLVLVGVVFWSILLVGDRPLTSTPPPLGISALPLLLAIGAVNLKLTAIPLLVIAGLFFAWQQRGQWRALGIGMMLLVAGLLPMLAAGVIKTGCPLYPSTAFCLNLPWAVPDVDVEKAAAGTHQWISWYGDPPAGAIPWVWAFVQWFREDKLNQLTMGLAAIAPVCLGYGLYHRRWGQGKVWVGLGAIAGFLFLMSTAPFLRFSFAYVLVPPAMVMAGLLTNLPSGINAFVPRLKIRGHLPYFHSWAAALGTGILMLSVTLAVVNGRLWVPPPMRQVPTQIQATNGIFYAIPQNGELCWATKIPCAFEALDSVHLRNPDRGLGAGFMDTRLSNPTGTGSASTHRPEGL